MKKKLLTALFTAIVACLLAFTVSAANEVTLTDDTTVDLEVAFKVEGNTVKGFNDGYSKDNIKDVVFPESITTIKSLSFNNSTVLETVIFEASETLVLDNVSFNASSVQKVTFNPECVLTYKSGNFYNCKSLTEITFPKFAALTGNCFQFNENMVPTNEIVFVEGITTINCHMFNGCKKVWGSVVIPSTVTTIKEGTFNSTAITSFDFSKCTNLTSIGGGYGGTFANLSALESIDLSPCVNLTKFDGGSMFEGCKVITEIILPEKLEKIPGKTFAHCYQLQSLVLPASVTTIAEEAFHSARRGQENMTFTLYIQGDITLCSRYAFRDSSAKVEFVLLGGKITAEQFKATNAGIDIVQSGKHSLLDEIEVVPYLSESGAFVPGQSRTAHVIVDGYCASLVLEGDHKYEANPCVINCEECGLVTVKESPEHNFVVTIVYENGYDDKGAKNTTCTSKGCPFLESEEASAIFVCYGYSASEFGTAGITIGYYINKEAVAEYETLTGATVGYGTFAVAQEKLGANNIFDENGVVSNGVIKTEVIDMSPSAISLKIIGFEDDQKDTKLAFGAYVAVNNGESTAYSYLQSGTPSEGEKYYFASYNDVLALTK